MIGLSDVTVKAEVQELLAMCNVFEGESLSYQSLNSDPCLVMFDSLGSSLS